MATRQQPLDCVPGCELPFQWPDLDCENSPLLASALDASEGVQNCWTVRERTMIALMNELTDLPHWEHKIIDRDWVSKWKDTQLLTGKDVTKPMVDWCVEELRWYLPNYLKTSIVPAIDGGVMKSDTRVPDSLLFAIQKATAALREESCKNPNHEDGIVSNVVDPFLFAFSWEQTRVIGDGHLLTLTDCLKRYGDGDLLSQPFEEHCVEKNRKRYKNDMAWSRRFQWLPFEVEFDDKSGGSCTISSYINNVHPEFNQDFYKALETLMDTTIPLFNQSLVEIKSPGYQNVRLSVFQFDYSKYFLISKDVGKFTPPEQRAAKKFVDAQSRYHKWLFVNLKNEFWNSGLQMVCEVREFDLSKDKTYYEGEPWHVQGQRNEFICATAIFIYSVHNVKQARLSFRRRVETDQELLACFCIKEAPFAPEIFGARDGDAACQHIGDVNLREGRVISFPNIWQTRLLPFKLEDKGRPGHIKLLSLHLVDPNRRIISTSRVPPQRRDWWAHTIRQQNAVLWRLPKEIWALIVDMVEDLPICRVEADQMRKEFWEERAESQGGHVRAMEKYGKWYLPSRT